MQCNNPDCDSGKPVFARGLCQPCYHRQRRNGTATRLRAPNLPGALCSVEGCKRKRHAGGFCSGHYQQARGYLRNTWQTLRSRAQGTYPLTWDNWESFVEEVHAELGVRPSDKHQLRRPNPLMPWGSGNMVWREPIGIGTTTAEEMAHYQWIWNIRNKYGLTVEEVELIIDSQNGSCPICTQPLGYFGPTSRKEAVVIVDHDHDHVADGKDIRYAVRGVTHRICNSGMGQLGDDAENCHRAGDHLDAHARRKRLGINIIDEIMERIKL